MTLFIDIINRSTVVEDAALAPIVAAVQQQVTADLVPFWGAGCAATLALVGKNTQPDPPRGTLPAHHAVWVKDHSDDPGALGYHVDDNGIIQAEIFAADDLEYNALLSVTVSHEVLEMLVDPLTTRVAVIDGVTYSVEVGDPVEADGDGYMVLGQRVSNFVTPAYFGLPGPADPRVDFRALLAAPCPVMRPGGYSMQFVNGVWKTDFALLAERPSYRAMRSKGRTAWRARRLRQKVT